MVWIREGLKQIRDIREGDEVLAWDPATNAPVLKPVVSISSRLAATDIWLLKLQDAGGKQSTTIVTGNHPYLLAANDNAALAMAANDNSATDATVLRIAPGGDWKIVKNLKPGDKLRNVLNGRVDGARLLADPQNDLLTVVSLELDRSPRQVYNFEVEGLQSYAVGSLGEWVHNNKYRDDNGKDINPNRDPPPEGHKTNKTPSNKPKHEAGDARRGRDQWGGEKGDKRRDHRCK
jgi:hypothetical protein